MSAHLFGIEGTRQGQDDAGAEDAGPRESGLDALQSAKLSVSSPAPTTSITDSETSATTSPRRPSPVTRSPVAPPPPSLSVVASDPSRTCIVATIPKAAPATIAISTDASATRQSRLTSSARGIDPGTSASIARVAQIEKPRPSAVPITDLIRTASAWKRPIFAVLLALFWGSVAVAAIIGLGALSSARRPTELAANEWEWVGRAALILTAPAGLVLIWSAWVLIRAFPDLWRHQTITGEIVRDRRYRQHITSGNDPKYWYYLAIDDGTADHVTALRLGQSIWQGHNQGEDVVAEVTPNLRFVRALRTDAASTPGQPIRSSG